MDVWRPWPPPRKKKKIGKLELRDLLSTGLRKYDIEEEKEKREKNDGLCDMCIYISSWLYVHVHVHTYI